MKVIKIVSNSIKLGQFLKFSGVVLSGGMVKNFLEKNTVFVNDYPTKSRGKQLFNGDKIQINDEIFVIEAE